MIIVEPDIDYAAETRLISPIIIERTIERPYDWNIKSSPFSEFQKSYWNKFYLIEYENHQNQVTFETGDPSTYLSLKKEELPTYFDRNIEIIREAYKNEVKVKGERESEEFEIIQEAFARVSKFIAELDFESATVEITNSESIKFVLLFKEKTILMISKSLYPEKFEFDANEVIYSLFINRKLITSDVSEISEFTQGFKKYLAM